MAGSNIKGFVFDLSSKQPLEALLIQNISTNTRIFSDQNGAFSFDKLTSGRHIIKITALGYTALSDTIYVNENATFSKNFYLKEAPLMISEIIVNAQKDFSLNTLSALDIKLRPHTTTQDLLRLVPGLFIAQHAGGGKAEQIFLRGFDVDHGTDVAVSVDDMPVNMVSHAHGQGYADLHFVIPETVDKIDFSKGSYDATTGNFNTAGAVRFKTKKILPANLIKSEIGSFNTYRGVVMFNLFNEKDTIRTKQHAYIASEYFTTKGFVESPQKFNRINLFGKYTNQLTSNLNLIFSACAFSSTWYASGQIPERAVSQGIITRYGSIDNSEGGKTSRYNFNLKIVKRLKNNSFIENNLYYVRNNFNLYSNFTFFKNDSLNGDQIFQFENRNIYGYNSSYSKDNTIGNLQFKTQLGIGLRGDYVTNSGLSNTVKRVFINYLKKGTIHETNASAYVDETIIINPKLSLNLGLRFDYFRFEYIDKLSEMKYEKKSVYKSITCPKLNLYYNLNHKIQLYFSTGTGYHSNDSRGVVNVANQNTVPRSISADIGTSITLFKKIFLNTALWWMNLESEYTYAGDDGFIGPNGKTQRIGVDLSARLQLFTWLYADADLNLAKPRFVNEPIGQNYVPLAPTITSVAGINIVSKQGFNISLRYRYLGTRPAIEDNSIEAKGYFITDLVASYKVKKIQLGVTIENLLNKTWNEAQFATESKLKTESAPITELHYTPGTPFNIRVNVSYNF
ncbi:MAG: putative tonB-dependent receptor [Bacteroidota bacterium]